MTGITISSDEMYDHLLEVHLPPFQTLNPFSIDTIMGCLIERFFHPVTDAPDDDSGICTLCEKEKDNG